MVLGTGSGTVSLDGEEADDALVEIWNHPYALNSKVVPRTATGLKAAPLRGKGAGK